jgi:cell division septation protein DedD
MAETTEKELILGNKQLISLFFVVVALCGVFFAMGYMIGRNSAKTTLAADTTPAGEVSGQKPQPSAAESAEPAAPLPAPAETMPARDEGASAAATPAPEPPRPEPPKPVETAKAAPAATTPVSVPQPGASYLQVTALPREEAESMVKTLRDESFPAILATSSKEGLFRVLVGPYHETAKLADAKSRLKTLGFANAFVQKQ